MYIEGILNDAFNMGPYKYMVCMLCSTQSHVLSPRRGKAKSLHDAAQKMLCLHLIFSHAMALNLDANVFQSKMNAYNENLIFASKCLSNTAASPVWSHFEACD